MLPLVSLRPLNRGFPAEPIGPHRFWDNTLVACHLQDRCNRCSADEVVVMSQTFLRNCPTSWCCEAMTDPGILVPPSLECLECV